MGLTNHQRLNRPSSIYQYFTMAWRLLGQNGNFLKVPQFLEDTRKQKTNKQTNKNGPLPRKFGSHVKILINRTRPVEESFKEGLMRAVSVN